MQVNVIPGKTYAVSSSADCTVTCEHNGRTYTLCTASGGQAYFVPPVDTVTISDDTAIITETFNTAALTALGSGGNGGNGGSGTPEGDYAIYDSSGAIIEGRLDNLIDGTYLQARRVTLSKWDIPLPSLRNGNGMFSGFSSSSASFINLISKWDLDLPSLEEGSAMFEYCRNLINFKSSMPKLKNGSSLLANSRIELFDSYCPMVSTATSMFAYNPSLVAVRSDLSSVTHANQMCYSCSSLRVFESELPVLEQGQNMFYSCQLNKASALLVLNSIPKKTDGKKHYIGVGIHVDHQSDEEVLTAISSAESRGWTMTVQWNGTAGTSTASTYGMRGPLVYARVIEDEHGRHLEWGHYVTDPEGYEEFRSVDSARAYFGIEE